MEGRIRSADSVRVARVREPLSGETGSPGDDHLDDIVVEREARVDSAWKSAMAEVLTEAMRRFAVPEICPRVPGDRRIRFGVQFIARDARATIILYLADRCFEYWSGRAYVGSAEMRSTAPRILALLKQAFPADTTVRHLDLKGLISCEDYHREHPDVSQIEQPPEVTRRVPPRYPKEAKKARVEGRVLLRVMIGPDGVASEVKVLESVAGLDAAAIASVREWEFAPALDCWGNPAASSLDIPVRFKLD
jgi:TonB family protein